MTGTIWQPDLEQYGGPKYLALTRALREAIRNGQLSEQAQLPTVRDLAWALKVTPGTVARAYHLATQEGLLSATVGRGTFVAARAPRLGPQEALYTDRAGTADSGPVDLRPPLLPDVGQGQAIAAAMARVGARADIDWIDYPTQSGEAPLRAAVLDWLADRDLGPVDPSDVALTNGGQNALLSIMLCCLRSERPVVLVEEPSYAGFRYAARLARAEVVGIDVDDEGMLPEALLAACRRHGPQVLCLTPEAQNPTTGRMSATRRAAIVRIARDFDLQVIEDASYGTSETDLPSLRAMAPERVWHTGGLSKSVSAALRFGFIICPRGMGEAARLTAQHSYFALSRLLMEVVADLMQSGEAARLRALAAAEMEERVDMLVARLGRFGLRWRPGLPICWLPMPSGWRASRFARAAEAEGVLVRAADEYTLVHGRAPNAVRVAIAGNMPRDRLDGALLTLVRLLDNPPFEVAV